MKKLIAAFVLFANPAFGQGFLETISEDQIAGTLLDVIATDSGDLLDVMAIGDPGSGEINFYRRNTDGFDWQPDQTIAFQVESLELDRQFNGNVYHAIAGNTNGTVETFTYDESINFWFSTGVITPPTPTPAGFGFAVEIDYNANVPLAFVSDVINGIVYVYERIGSAWSLAQQINDPDPQSGFLFGTEISYDQEFLVVSDPLDSNEGRAYIYQNFGGGSTFSLYQTLTPSAGFPAPPGLNNLFGSSVDIENDLMAISDINADNASGRVYIYELGFPGGVPSWSLSTVVAAGDGAANDQFGFSVDVDFAKDRVAVGAPGAEDDVFPATYNHGAGYVFGKENGVWNELYRVRGPESIIPNDTQSDSFGFDVSIDNQYVLFGRPRYGTLQEGCVDVFAAEDMIVSLSTVQTTAGGIQRIKAYAGPSEVGNIYFLYGAFNPQLVFDDYTSFILNSFNSVIFPDSVGVISNEFIDGTINVPAGTAYVGLLYHSFVILDIATLTGGLGFDPEDLSLF